MSPWGSAIACTVRRSEQLLHSLQGFKGFKGKRLRPGKRQAWTPITGCKVFKRFKDFKGFKGLRAGGCGLGAAVACAVRRSEQLLDSLQGCKNFKGKCLRPGKRQAWTPITGCKGFKGFEGFKAF